MERTTKHNVKWTMLATVMVMWAALNSLFFKRYVEVVSGQTDLAPKIIAVGIILWIVLSSFYACFHIVSFLFSVMVERFWNRIARDYSRTPGVAILYPCMNDLKEKAIMSFLNQDYSDYHLYILDDSTTAKERERAGKLQIEHSERISIIRRPEQNGFKAGNLNYALGQIKNTYKYFAVMDADEIAPPNFLRETVAITEANPNIGFVQACHRQYSDTDYGKKTGDGIDLHWSYFLPARNLFGFVYFYGHGALIRTKACVEACGFPEIVAEDVALATKMRELGYRGYYTNNVICQEEVPPSYAAWRMRNGKVVRGTLEFLFKAFPSFARAKNVSFAEKFDLMISSSILFLPILFFCFLVLLHIIMPFFSKDSYSVTCSWFGTSDTGYIRTAMGLFKPLWGWDTLMFTLFTVFAPLCYLIPNFVRSPLKVFRYTWKMTAIHLSGTLHVLAETFGWLLTHRAVFNATANNSRNRKHTPNIYIEGTIGFLFLVCSVVTGSLCLMAVGLSITLVPLLMKTDMRGKLCATLVLLPMAFTLATFCAVPLGMIGVTGVFACVALAHH